MVAMPIVSATRYSGRVLTNSLLLNAWLKVAAGQRQPSQGANYNSGGASGRLQCGPFLRARVHVSNGTYVPCGRAYTYCKYTRGTAALETHE